MSEAANISRGSKDIMLNPEVTTSSDYDTPWKEVIEQYFPEFIAFFFPQAYGDIDWQKGYEFLDKELQQITKDAEIGRKYVDKLVRVWLKSGDDAWAIIHADIQSQTEKDFAGRMYTYNYRLFDRYRRHAASFAILGDSSAGWRPDIFEQNLWGCDIRFRFPVIKLSDYEKDRDNLRQNNNPFALIVMAHLLAQTTAKNHEKRMIEKLALIKELYRKKFSKQNIINLFRFIDWIMALPETQEKLLWHELSVMEKEGKMPYITSVERIGFQQGMKEGVVMGIQQGVQQGVQQGMYDGIFQSLKVAFEARFGADGISLHDRIKHISDIERLKTILETIIKAKTPEEVFKFIEN